MPQSLRTCRGIPASPKGNYTQKDVGRYAVTLAGSLKDCRNKLNAVDHILTEHDAAAKAALPGQ